MCLQVGGKEGGGVQGGGQVGRQTRIMQHEHCGAESVLLCNVCFGGIGGLGGMSRWHGRCRWNYCHGERGAGRGI